MQRFVAKANVDHYLGLLNGSDLRPDLRTAITRLLVVEDDASGLILQFECANGRTRLVIAGASLPYGNREILFDDDGCEAAAGTLVGSFRRPSWLKEV